MQELGGEIINTIDPYKLVWVDARQQLISPPPTINVSLWPLFNELTGGLRMKEFSIFCGPTGAGKTAFLANLSANLLSQRIKHFVASVETGPVDFVLRVNSALLGEDLNTGDAFDEKKIKEIDEKLDFFCKPENKTELYLSNIDSRMSCDFLVKKLTYAHEQLGCKIAILDNLNFFLEVKSFENSIVEMDRVIHTLIMFCKRTDMHVIMVMHPKKTENGRVESEFDIKGSSTAVQEAHNVFLFNRPKKEEIENGEKTKYMRELKAAKLRRRGRYTGKTILFDGETPNYKEVKII